MSLHVRKLRHLAAMSLLIMAMCCACRLMAAGQGSSVPGIAVPQLEVTSVRQSDANQDPNAGGVGMRPDGIHTENTSLHFILGVAFNRQFGDDQIVGEPSWSKTDHFDAIGKVAEADFPKLRGLSSEQHAAMRAALLRVLLAERFHLRTHFVEREGPVYALVVAKGGSKLKQANNDAPREMVAGDEHLTGAGASLAIKGKVAGHVVTTTRLVAGLLSVGQLDRPVIDRTGLSGTYDYYLVWSPDRPGSQQDNGANDTNLPSLFLAVQEQLGLKLEPGKGLIKTLVIDSVDRPSAN